MTTPLRPTDIALSLSAEAREDLVACARGYFWVVRLTGAPLELLQARLIRGEPPFTSGKGYLITPTQLGSEVARAIINAPPAVPGMQGCI
jgi:hypothetical protein